MTASRAAPPYRQIVEDVRRRVARGELRAGDRLPSTRSLARRWRVATATATHALRELIHAGVVRAIPRVGFVVAGTPDVAPRENELSRARVVRAAIAIADDEGLPALSIRGVAARLEAPAMSLYRHVASKEDLVRAMAEEVMSDAPPPTDTPRGLRARLIAALRAQWTVYRKHPWMARVITLTRPPPLPRSLDFAERLLGALRDAGFDAHEAMRLHIVLYGYVQGLATSLEAEAQARSETGLDEESWMAGNEQAFVELARSGRYPAFAGVMTELQTGFDLDVDEIFETGLAVLARGIEATAHERTKRRRG